MNPQNKNIAIIIGIIIVLAIIIGIVVAKNKSSETAEMEGQNSPTPSSQAVATPVKTGKSSVSPLPANTLVLLSPVGGEMFHSGSMAHITWDSSVSLENAKVVVTLLKDGREITNLTDPGGTLGDAKQFNWEIQDLSVWGEDGFSIKITTTGLLKNLSAQSGTFKVIKSS